MIDYAEDFALADTLARPDTQDIGRMSRRRRNRSFSHSRNKDRLNGKMSKNPAVSVRNPGVSNSRPPARTRTPSISSLPGSSPRSSEAWILDRTANPCQRARVAPATPVKRTSASVAHKPIREPISRRRYSSTNGTAVKTRSNRKNMFFPDPPITELNIGE